MSDRRLTARWARGLVRARWVILAFWIGAAVAATLALPTIREAQVGALGDLVPHDAKAIDAEQRSFDLFGFPLLSRTVVVERDPDGLSASEQAGVVRRAVLLNRHALADVDGIAGALPATNALGRPPFSRERSTTALTYLFFDPGVGQAVRVGLARRFVAYHVPARPGAFAGVTGAIPARAAQADLIGGALPGVELATVALVALAMALFFRAPGPPLVTLATVAVAYAITVRLVAVAGQAIGVSVPSEIEPVIVVLLFGVVTDYSIFFLARMRRRLRDGHPRLEAAERTTSDLLGLVSAAALAVVLGGAALAVARLGFLQAFGPGIAMTVLIALVVTVTLVPALLAVSGGRLFWPRGVARADAADRRAAPADAGRGRRVIRLAVDHPRLTGAVSVAVLLALASGLGRLEPGNPLIRGLPPASDPHRAYRQASAGFAAGVLSPTVVVVEGAGVVAERPQLARLQRLLAREPGVAQVLGPADQPLRVALGAALSRTGDAARFLVVLDSDPLGAVAIRRFSRLQERLPYLLARAGLDGARASSAGDTALVAETVNGTAGDTVRVLPVVLLALFGVLAVFLRSLVAPLYLLAASILGVAAALGLTVCVFQDALHREITYFVPFAAAVLLLSLGSDYTIYLAGRVWQEGRRLGLREAVIVGGSRAATSIAVAGGVLAGSFALLALVPLRSFRELAFAMASGLLIDAFLVRTLLVPALISLFGTRSAWPGRRLHDRGPSLPELDD